MLVSVWGLLTALVLAHMPVGQPALRHAGAQALRTALFGAPLMLLLFVLFPRIGPLWGMPQEMIGKTGLSGTMQLGAMAEIANDDSIALRVRFLDGARAPEPNAMYLRGPVLTAFDGREWRAPRLRAASIAPRRPQVSGRAAALRDDARAVAAAAAAAARSDARRRRRSTATPRACGRSAATT